MWFHHGSQLKITCDHPYTVCKGKGDSQALVTKGGFTTHNNTIDYDHDLTQNSIVKIYLTCDTTDIPPIIIEYRETMVG
jgi:hypothetical protein